MSQSDRTVATAANRSSTVAFEAFDTYAPNLLASANVRDVLETTTTLCHTFSPEGWETSRSGTTFPGEAGGS